MIRAALNCAIAAAALWHADLFAAAPGQVRELSRLSLEDLANVEVTSVSKAAQSLSAAPAAIYVITREEILRSGVTSIPEALRLTPNLQVTQISAGSYAISARGFGDKREVQTQANKLLILIDGRSVYSPLFSGVFYDAQDIMMEDVERIEVISGPGATLWGANAMNGVINIITRPAADTQGTVVRAGSRQPGECSQRALRRHARRERLVPRLRENVRAQLPRAAGRVERARPLEKDAGRRARRLDARQRQLDGAR